MIVASFILSGISALIYEIIWSRMLGLVFGASIYGQSITLALYMGGLSIGSKIIADCVHKYNNPAILYGYLELITAIFGFCSIFLLPVLEYFEINNVYLDLIIKIIICAIFILPPTIAMGGTFSVLFKTLALINPNQFKPIKTISNLYTVNTIGALIGIAISNYFLIPEIGMNKSLIIAGIFNVTIFILFFIFYKNFNFLKLTNENNNKIETPHGLLRGMNVRKIASRLCLLPNLTTIFGECDLRIQINKKVLIALGISGFITMLYEISWARALYFSFGSSTFTFSLIIFAFIFGLSLGSFWVRNLDLLDNNKKTIFYWDLQSKTIFGASVFIFLALRFPLISDDIFKYCNGVFWKIHLIEIIISILIISPAAFFIGGTFPILIGMLSKDNNNYEKLVGIAYSVNTLGSIIGSIITGFVLIPIFGPFEIIYIAVGLHLFCIFLTNNNFIKKYLFNNFLIIFLSIIFLMVQFGNYKTIDLFTGFYANVYNNTEIIYPKFFKSTNLNLNTNFKNSKPELIFSKHGAICSVAVIENNFNTRLVINGKTDASVGNFSNSDMPTQSMLAILPLLYSNPVNGLVIGFGSGVTSGILSKYTKNLDCIEIEKSVIDASKYFKNYNFDVVNKKNVNIKICDARKYIRKYIGKYDFISAEPSNIWVSGVAHLFTKEYFRDCYNILNNNGVMVQWLHIYKISLNDFKIAIKTFSTIFNNYVIFSSVNLSDVFIVGFKNNSTVLDKEKFEKIFNNFYYRLDFESLGIKTFENFLNYKLISNIELSPKLLNTPIHTDDLPILEYSSIKNMFTLERNEIYKFLDQ